MGGSYRKTWQMYRGGSASGDNLIMQSYQFIRASAPSDSCALHTTAHARPYVHRQALESGTGCGEGSGCVQQVAQSRTPNAVSVTYVMSSTPTIPRTVSRKDGPFSLLLFLPSRFFPFSSGAPTVPAIFRVAGESEASRMSTPLSRRCINFGAKI